MMLSMNIRCNTCGNYIYKGPRSIAGRKVVVSETYLGTQIFIFYFKCTKCSSHLTITTDPQNSDYVVELGATRNFEPWRKQDELVKNEKRKREAEEMGDAMKCLENKTQNTKREMDILAALVEIKSIKSRHATVDVDGMLEVLQRTSTAKEKKLEEEDEALLKSIVFHTSKGFVCRIKKEDSEDEEDLIPLFASNDESLNNIHKKRKLSEEFLDKPTDLLIKATSSVPIFVVKKAAPTYNICAKFENTKQDGPDKKSALSIGLQSVLLNYGSSDDDDDD